MGDKDQFDDSIVLHQCSVKYHFPLRWVTVLIHSEFSGNENNKEATPVTGSAGSAHSHTDACQVLFQPIKKTPFVTLMAVENTDSVCHTNKWLMFIS